VEECRTDSPAILIPDAGPLITLAYAHALDVLIAPGWPVWIVDMVQHEVTRNHTPTSERIGRWIIDNANRMVRTALFDHYLSGTAGQGSMRKPSNLGELAAQEAMNSLATTSVATRVVFLFEDHRIARASFVLPAQCTKISTRAYLQFLEQTGHIASARTIERAAIENGRQFSALRYPPPSGQ